MIWVVIGLLLTGLATGLLAAWIPTRGHWQIVHPRRALLLWAVAGILGLLLTATSVLYAAVHSLHVHPAGAVAESMTLTLVAWMGLGGLGVAGSLALLGRGDLGDEDGERPGIAELLSRRRTTSWQSGRITIVQIDDPRLIAVASASSSPTIFVSSTARNTLAPSHLAAIIAHEAAHLHQRHALARHLGAWRCACLPKRSRLRRDLTNRILLLTELAADDSAASRVGPAHLLDALSSLHALAPSRELAVRAARVRSVHGLLGNAPTLHRPPHRTDTQRHAESQ